jgi:hypothetical protein
MGESMKADFVTFLYEHVQPLYKAGILVDRLISVPVWYDQKGYVAYSKKVQFTKKCLTYSLRMGG